MIWHYLLYGVPERNGEVAGSDGATPGIRDYLSAALPALCLMAALFIGALSSGRLP